MRPKHFLNFENFSRQDLSNIIDRAIEIKSKSETSKLIDAVVLACSLSLAILWQGELRRLMELLGTGRLTVLLGSPPKEFRATSTTITQLVDAAGKLSKNRRGALIYCSEYVLELS